MIDDDGETTSGAGPKYRSAEPGELRKAEQIAVGKISDLDTFTGHELHVLLRAWTVIIKEGKGVREVSSKDAKKTSKFAAQKTQHCLLQFSEPFVAKHRKLVGLATGTDGNWFSQISPGSAEGSKRAAYEIDCLEDYRRFLLKQRRFEGRCFGPITCSRVLGME